MCALKNGGFFLQLDLAIEVNHHFLTNEYGDLSFLAMDMQSVETTISIRQNT